jgi:ABC-2 type transport system ATP-binding protein
MSTHTLEVADEMCDRISIILKGRIIARGTVDELRAMAGGAASDDRDSAGGRGEEANQLTAVFLRLTGGSALQEIDEAVG